MDLSDEERLLIREIVIKHRLIMGGSGYGKIIIEYSKGDIDITSNRSDKTRIKINAGDKVKAG